jgi:hypothetical protein
VRRRLPVALRMLRRPAARPRAVTPDAVIRTLPAEAVPAPWARSAFSAGAARNEAALPSAGDGARRRG